MFTGLKEDPEEPIMKKTLSILKDRKYDIVTSDYHQVSKGELEALDEWLRTSDDVLRVDSLSTLREALSPPMKNFIEMLRH